MRIRRQKSLVYLLAGAVAAFVIGRLTAQWPAYHPPTTRSQFLNVKSEQYPTVGDLEQNFSVIVSAWNSGVASHDGFLPPDPYRAIFDSRHIGSLAGLRSYDFARHLPPRLNPDLARNPKWPVFWWTPGNALDEVWICYADGSWNRRPESETGADWFTPVRDAGYPVQQWSTWSEKAEWLQRNKNRLTWDDKRQLYVCVPK
jgi:hypothetical protein